MSTFNANASFNYAFLGDVDKPRNQFEFGSSVSDTFNSQYINVLKWYLVHPGETYHLKGINPFVRLNPLVSPTFDMLYLEMFAFFIPFRLIWEHTKAFFGEVRNPDDATEYNLPIIDPDTIPSTGFPTLSIYDQMNYAPEYANVSELPLHTMFLRGYNITFNQWFRNENLQDSLPDNFDDGPDNYNDYKLVRRCKKKDFITSCLPFTQKGSPVTITIPDFQSDVSVYGNGKTLGLTNGSANVVFGNNSQQVPGAFFQKSYFNHNVTTADSPDRYTGKGAFGVTKDKNSSGLVGVSNNVNVPVLDINQFRSAIQVQGWKEINAFYGTRYSEFIYGHYGVHTSDMRSQIPELLAMSSIPIDYSIVPQTSSTDSASPQGNLTSYGVFANSGSDDENLSFYKSFEEYGVILILYNVRSNINYSQRIDKQMTISSALDFYYPEFAHLGYEEVKKYEVSLTNSDLMGTFGYNERYYWAKSDVSQVRGLFRPYVQDNLGTYNFSEEFSGEVELNSAFIQDATSIVRSLAIKDEPEFLGHFKINMDKIAPLPLFGNPSTLL